MHYDRRMLHEPGCPDLWERLGRGTTWNSSRLAVVGCWHFTGEKPQAILSFRQALVKPLDDINTLLLSISCCKNNRDRSLKWKSQL